MLRSRGIVVFFKGDDFVRLSIFGVSVQFSREMIKPANIKSVGSPSNFDLIAIGISLRYAVNRAKGNCPITLREAQLWV